MDLITLLRAAITSGGGTPASFNRIQLLQQLVTTYGGTPTKFTVTGLLREAIIARGGTPTQQTITALLRELIVVLGATPTTYTEQALLVQLAGLSIGGVVTPPAPVFSTQPSISPTGGTAGSTAFTATNGTASNTTSYTRRWLLNGSAVSTAGFYIPPSAGSLVLEVTATGPGGSTIATTGAVTVAAAGGGSGDGFPSTTDNSLPVPTLTLATGQTSYPPQFDIGNLADAIVGDTLWIEQRDKAGALITRYSNTIDDAEAAAEAASFGLTSITTGTFRYSVFLARGSVVSVGSVEVIHGPDDVEPTLSLPTATGITGTNATVGAFTNEDNGTLYAVLTTANTAPSALQVENGQSSTGAAAAKAGSVAVTSTGAKTIPLTGLTASTTYYLWLMHKDAAGNRSAVLTGGSVTTAAAAASTLDSAFKTSGITLSGPTENVATATATGDNRVLTVKGPSTGKYYLEWRMLATAGGEVWFGFHDRTGYTGSPGAGFPVFLPDGYYVDGIGGSGFGPISYDAIETFGVAVDCDTNKLFFRGSSGWASGDPGAGGAGTPIADVGNFYFVVKLANNSASASVNDGAQAFTYTPPTGFTALKDR